MKLGHYFISALFFFFAMLQWNDPDPYLWIALYLLISTIPLFHIKANTNTFLLGALAFVILLVSATYVPELVSWIDEGMPSITTSMKAESPHIELIRESLGLFICLIVVSFYYFKSKNT